MQFMKRLPTRLFAVGLLGLSCGSGTLVASSTQVASAEPPLQKMFAIYRVRFLGANLGKFKLWADLNKGSYSIRSETKLEMGFIIKGLFFKLKGGAESKGAMKGNVPVPKRYGLHFESKRKRGRLDMTFNGNRVHAVTSQPQMRENPKAVPVTNAHVTKVLDPLAGVFLTQLKNKGKNHADACRQKVGIFDGKHRFDLILSHKKTVRVKRSGKRGYSGMAVVCRIRYAPVSGHTPNNKGLVFFEKNKDIEVWLIPVPGTRAYVPYHLSLPTPYGQATAISSVFEVRTARGQNHSLVKYK